MNNANRSLLISQITVQQAKIVTRMLPLRHSSDSWSYYTSGGSRPGVWGGSQIGGAKNVFTSLNTKVVCDNRCASHKRGYLL